MTHPKPTERFVRLTRNPDAVSAWPFRPTDKRSDDVVIGLRRNQ